MTLLQRYALRLGCLLLSSTAFSQGKPPLSLDEFMNTTEIRSAKISPDGTAAVIATTSPDWKANRFRSDLWLWTRATGTLHPLTHSGRVNGPEWSPDGKYIAFVSDRSPSAPEEGSGGDDKQSKDEPGRVWLLPVSGGEAFPLYHESLDVHAFAWSPDGSSIVFSVTEPLSKNAEEAQKQEWKDVVRWRERERGDVLLRLTLSSVVRASVSVPEAHEEPKPDAEKPVYPQGAQVVTRSSRVIEEVAPSPGGDQLAFETGPTSHREEDPGDPEVYLVPSAGGDARQLTHNQAIESGLRWDPSGKRLYLLVRAGGGSLEGPYRDVQGRLYSVDSATGAATRLGSSFEGSWGEFAVTADGKLLAAGQLGVNQGIYRVEAERAELISAPKGSFEHLSTAAHGKAVLFTRSAITEPMQVFLANDAAKLMGAEKLSNYNPIFNDRAKVGWRTFDWKSDDGAAVQGVLIFPPGALPSVSGAEDAGAAARPTKPMRMLTLIHGGPEDADGDRFGADWYSWAVLAAEQGWVVFQPNYRGSTGYGDPFMLSIQPKLVSSPGKDILAGVDALEKAGIADPAHLAIGGYSYGGYMTNWLITQTPRFKAAVTGAGAVEHAANWGFDDLTFDDAWYLSGAPWEKPEIYQSEAALFQMDKVKTPTHIVGGGADDRVSFFEQIVLERALQRLAVPHALLQFPGENHPLATNPWHGYIKVREELKWLDKYAGQ